MLTGASAATAGVHDATDGVRAEARPAAANPSPRWDHGIFCTTNAHLVRNVERVRRCFVLYT